MPPIQDALTIDVEDWFHVLDLEGAPSIGEWANLPSRVEKNFESLLEILAEREVRATCFFLGWVAERFPHLVRRAVDAGHEIASHGYAHELIYEQGEEAFFADVQRSKAILEDTSRSPVVGYRAPGFSIVKETPWALRRLVEAGFRYDASIFPGARGHGGLAEAPLEAASVDTGSGEIVEFPISMVQIAGRRVCFFGGGYLRLFPYGVIHRMAQQVKREGRFVVFYVHPREIDPEQPRIPMNWKRRFKSYVNIATTEKKLRRLVRDFEFKPLVEFLETDQIRSAPTMARVSRGSAQVE